MQPLRFQDLTLEDQFLLDEAERAMANAYGPYSNLHLGCAVRSMNKRVYIGANLEQAPHDTAVCAERAALSAANTASDRALEALALIGTHTKHPLIEPPIPCGLCRQCLFEFAELSDRDILVICSDTAKTKIVVGTIREMLPRPWSARSLQTDLDRYRPILPKPSF